MRPEWPRLRWPLALVAGFLTLRVLVTCTGGPPPAPRHSAAPPVAPAAPLAPAAAAAPVDWPGTRREPAPRDRAELERLVFLLSNRVRVLKGLAPLRGDATLAAVAREHSEDMLRRRYFQHDSPEGLSPDQRIHRGHRTLFGTTGENLWHGSGYTFDDLPALARGIVEDWMASPGHRENLLRPEFTHLGVGLAVADGGKILATQNFAAVRAYLQRPFPKQLPSRTEVRLALEDLDLVAGAVSSPRLLAFQGDSGADVDPSPLGAVHAPAEPGPYQLQLYFPQAAPNSFVRIPGPVVEVR